MTIIATIDKQDAYHCNDCDHCNVTITNMLIIATIPTITSILIMAYFYDYKHNHGHFCNHGDYRNHIVTISRNVSDVTTW